MNFKVGDRVAVYAHTRRTGKVIEVTEKNLRVELEAQYTNIFWFHPKQCRKIRSPIKNEGNKYWLVKVDRDARPSAFNLQEDAQDYFDACKRNKYKVKMFSVTTEE